jgi:hypothetical protein
MVQLNIANFITVGLIAILAVFLIRFAAKAMGKNAPV